MKFILLLTVLVAVHNASSNVQTLLNRFRLLILRQQSPQEQNDPTMCLGRPRVWGFCGGNPEVRSTVDNCTKRTEDCNVTQILASSFIKNFIAPQGIANSGQFLLRAQSLGGTCNEERGANNALLRGNCNAPTSGRRKRSIMETKRDLLIMMDESGSVGPNRFLSVKRLASNIIKLLCGQLLSIHPNVTRVAVSSFDGEVHFHKRLIDPNPLLNENAQYLTGYINFAVSYSKTSTKITCLNKALEHAHKVALNNTFGGRRGQSDVTQDIILITDGCANCNTGGKTIEDTIQEATNTLKQLKINVYVIGVGLSNQCQNIIKILAQGGKCFHFFFFEKSNLEALVMVLEQMLTLNQACIDKIYDQDQTCM